MFSQPYEGEKDGVIPIGDVRKAMMCVHANTALHLHAAWRSSRYICQDLVVQGSQKLIEVAK